ncbi:MAG: WD40 repeat domain-containing protein [Opitutaceae bacterium]|jgi:WD40 repeat protein|nr:WD40 repeat domain-containing protein [Opitutaceae bacterium]
MQLTKHWAAALDDYVIDLGWSPDGTLLAAASSAGPVSLFAAVDGTLQHALPGHDDGTNTLAWHPEALVLATGGQDGAVKFWDPRAGQHTATAPLGPAWVDHLAWRPGKSGAASPRPSALLAAAAGKGLTLLAADGAVHHAFAPAPKTITALVWEPRGGAVAVAYFGGVVLWDADDFVAQRTYAYANGIHALVWSPDGRWLVSGNQDPSVHLWLPEQDEEFHMSGYESKVKELTFDRTSRWLATGGGHEACIWDCQGRGPEGREPVMLAHEGKVCAVAYQHAHGLLATASDDGTVMIWSPERPRPLRATVRMPSPATRLVWSPDDRLLGVGSAKGAVYVLRCED